MPNTKEELKLHAGHLAKKKGYWYYVIEYTDPQGKRKPKWISTGLTIKGNKMRAEALLQEHRRNFVPPAPKGAKELVPNMQFTDYMLGWLEIARKSVAKTTFGGYQTTVNKKFLPYFSELGLTVNEVKPAHIQKFYLHELETLSNTSVRHEHTLLHEIMEHAYKMELIPNNPVDKVAPPRAERFEGSAYTEEEVQELLEKTADHRLGLLIYVTVLLGLRRSEVLGLRWKAIDFDENKITINHTVTEARVDGKLVIVAEDRTKTKSSYRTYPMGETLKARLLQWREVQKRNRKTCENCYNAEHLEYVFTDELGNRFKPRYIEDTFPKLLEKNGLRKIRFHDLRHTCATLMHKNNLSPKEVQEYLGHSNVSITLNIYTHLDWNSKENAAKVMENAIKVPENKPIKSAWED